MLPLAGAVSVVGNARGSADSRTGQNKYPRVLVYKFKQRQRRKFQPDTKCAGSLCRIVPDREIVFATGIHSANLEQWAPPVIVSRVCPPHRLAKFVVVMAVTGHDAGDECSPASIGFVGVRTVNHVHIVKT